VTGIETLVDIERHSLNWTLEVSSSR